jgi:hypothetical protein
VSPPTTTTTMTSPTSSRGRWPVTFNFC